MVKARLKKRRKKLDVNLAQLEQSKKARYDFRERTNSFQPDLETHTGAKRKLSVCSFQKKENICEFISKIVHYLDFAIQ
jgi:hypothetical protein